jgi:hypothetical protein
MTFARSRSILLVFLPPLVFSLQKTFKPTAHIPIRFLNWNDAVSTTYSRNYTAWTSIGEVEDEDRPLRHSSDNHEVPLELTYRQVFERFGVKPPWQVPPKIWRWCYYVHRLLLRFLHLGDPLVVPNSSLSGLILWWKALVGNDRKSPAYDDGWAGDLLPPATGWIAGGGDRGRQQRGRGVSILSLRRFFPRLNHANIELRTVYLNRAVLRTLRQLHLDRCPFQAPGSSTRTKVRLIILGAGYDLRGTKLLTEGAVDDVVELDLSEVIEAKRALWTQRLRKRRPDVKIPRFLLADLNDVDATQALLARIHSTNESQPSARSGAVWSTIYLAEGIVVHLQREAGHALLRAMSSSLPVPAPSSSSSPPRIQPSYFIFADALPHVTNRSLDGARAELLQQGWKLLDFVANPTKAPHMGIAVLA